MSISLGDAIVNIGADTSGLINGITGAQGSIGSFASGVLGKLGPVGVALGLVSGAALGVGVASVKMAGDFEESVTSLVTGAGESVKNVDMIKQGLLDMSVSTATPVKNLVDGLYMIESAGYHGAQGLTVLKAAAQGAKVGNADLGVVSNALTTILTDYHLSADQATGATNALVQTVADGKTHMQDLASALGSVLPLASSLGISLPQVAGGLAVMTNAGMSAQRASANLANAIRSLAAPNATAQKSMQAVGLTAQQLKDTLSTQGLTGAIQLIEEHVGQKFPAGSVQAVQAFKAIMGGATGYNVALMLGGKNMAAYESNVKNITAAMNSGKNGVQGWALVQGDFNFKLEQAKQAVNALMIGLGSALLPILSQVLSVVTPLIGQFGNWITSGNFLNTALGQLASGAFYQISYVVQSLVIPALQGFWTIAQAVIAYLNGDQFAGVIADFQTLGNQVLQMIVPAFQLLGPLVMKAFAVLGTILTGVVIPAIDQLVFGISQLIRFFQENEIGIAIFQAALVILGAIVATLVVGAIISLISMIPALVAGFAAWAGAAIAAGIANIIAFGPIILIALAVIAVITLIVLAVKHWGEIAHWLQSVWAGIASFFGGVGHAIMDAFGALGNWFTGLWMGIKVQAISLWMGLSASIQLTINHVVSWLKNIWTNTVHAVVDAFLWLYNHNYYFKDLVDFIVKTITGVSTWLQTTWKNITSWITVEWDLLKAYATLYWNQIILAIQAKISQIAAWLQSAWNAIVAVVQSAWNAIVSFLSPILSAIGNAIQSAWNAVSSATATAWQAVSSWVVQAWQAISGTIGGAWNTYISGPLGAVWNSVSGWFGNLATQALQWGKNLIQGFINGIGSMLGAVGQAASNVVGTVTSFLGFHSPAEQGPGRDADTWAPNLLKMFNAGLQEGQPALQATLNTMLAPHVYPSGMPTGALRSTTSGGNQQPMVLHNHVYIDGHQAGQAIINNMRLRAGGRM